MKRCLSAWLILTLCTALVGGSPIALAEEQEKCKWTAREQVSILSKKLCLCGQQQGMSVPLYHHSGSDGERGL